MFKNSALRNITSFFLVYYPLRDLVLRLYGNRMKNNHHGFCYLSHTHLIVYLASILILCCHSNCSRKYTCHKQMEKIQHIEVGMPYTVFFPSTIKKDKKYPLILFLHGAGERGDDNQRQMKHVVPYLISDTIQQKFSSIILVPQCPEDDYWAPVKRGEWTMLNNGAITMSMEKVVQILKKISLDKRVDQSKIYVIGLSMGGFGTCDIISRYPELFAAAVPICGGADLTKVNKFKDVPIWAFHGALDQVVSVKLSRDLISGLQQVGGIPIYTEYHDSGHNIWDAAVRDPKLLPWLFSQHKL